MTQFSNKERIPLKEEVESYLFPDWPIESADIAIVMGTQKGISEAAIEATRVYKTGLAPIILCTGYQPDEGGNVIEAEALRDELIKQGVSEDKILLENRSTNTLENVLFGLDVIKQKVGIKNVTKLIAVCKVIHARRSLMTLKKQFPDDIKIMAATYLPAYMPISRYTWDTTEEYRKRTLDEVARIERYLAKGDIAEI